MTEQADGTDIAAKTQIRVAAGPSDLGSHFPQRIALYFGAIFLVYGIHLTYFPVWLAWRGLSPEQIGFITAVPILLRAVLTPVIGAYADATGRHRTMIIALSVLSAALSIGAWMAPDTPWLVVTAVPFAVIMVSVLPLVDTVAVSGVRAAGHDYGRMRLWGSLTFLIATLLAGAMLDVFGAGSIMWGLIAATLATALTALLLPKPAEGSRRPRPSQTADAGKVGQLLRQPLFLTFIMAVGAIQGSHAAFYAFGALHLQGQGVSGSAFSTLWVIAILAETALFAWSAPFVAKIGAVRLLILGGVAAVVRWGIMSIDPPYGVVFALQPLHALTFAATHLGAIHFIAKAVPGHGAGTAQALHSAIGNGLIMAAAIYVSGQIYPSLAGATYLVMGALALTGTAAAVYVSKTWDGRPVL
ncbi:MAG: MFS transporter [Hyphomicrobiaceae bacterium]|nr:MFS transporter [Hyphomicrobiaceae bacterium]